MNTINAILTAITDGVLNLFSGMSPLFVLIAISSVVGVVMAVVFRYTSQQEALRRVADRSRAQVLAIKLFKDDLSTLFGSLGQLFRFTALRLWYSLPPALVMVVPFVLLLVQMARWYEHLPLVTGEAAAFEMRLNEDAWQRHTEIELQASDGLEIDTLPVREQEHCLISWRIRPQEPRTATIQWRVGHEAGEKRIAVAESKHAFCAVDRRLPGTGLVDRVMNPGESGLSSDSAVQAIDVRYIDHQRQTPLFGLNFPWWLTFLIVSMLAAIVVRPLVRVQF